MAGGLVTATPLTMREQGQDDGAQGQVQECRREQAEGAGSGHGQTHCEGSPFGPTLGQAAGEEAEDDEAERVQAEREGIALRGQPVHALENVGCPAQVGEDRGVGEAGDQHRANEHPVSKEPAEVVQGMGEPSGDASVGRQRLPEHHQ